MITKGSLKKQGKEGQVYVLIPPKPFRRGPPLNSTALLRLKSTKEKRRTTPTSIVSEGHRMVSCLDMNNLRNSRHTISPQKHCHQSPKPLRDKYAVTDLLEAAGRVGTKHKAAEDKDLSGENGFPGCSIVVVDEEAHHQSFCLWYSEALN